MQSLVCVTVYCQICVTIKIKQHSFVVVVDLVVVVAAVCVTPKQGVDFKRHLSQLVA